MQKSATDGIRTHAEFPPADLESAALDRSATVAEVIVLGTLFSLMSVYEGN